MLKNLISTSEIYIILLADNSISLDVIFTTISIILKINIEFYTILNSVICQNLLYKCCQRQDKSAKTRAKLVFPFLNVIGREDERGLSWKTTCAGQVVNSSDNCPQDYSGTRCIFIRLFNFWDDKFFLT